MIIGLVTLIVHSCWSIVFLCCLLDFIYLSMFTFLLEKKTKKKEKGKAPRTRPKPSQHSAWFSAVLGPTSSLAEAQQQARSTPLPSLGHWQPGPLLLLLLSHGTHKSASPPTFPFFSTVTEPENPPNDGEIPVSSGSLPNPRVMPL